MSAVLSESEGFRKAETENEPKDPENFLSVHAASGSSTEDAFHHSFCGSNKKVLGELPETSWQMTYPRGPSTCAYFGFAVLARRSA
jgi:hypothetical protein